MDETQQCKWNCEIKGHINWKWMTLVKDIYHIDVVVHMICQKLYKIVFLSFKSHGYQLYNVHMHSSCPSS
jgi:hypothetical protein